MVAVPTFRDSSTALPTRRRPPPADAVHTVTILNVAHDEIWHTGSGRPASTQNFRRSASISQMSMTRPILSPAVESHLPSLYMAQSMPASPALRPSASAPWLAARATPTNQPARRQVATLEREIRRETGASHATPLNRLVRSRTRKLESALERAHRAAVAEDYAAKSAAERAKTAEASAAQTALTRCIAQAKADARAAAISNAQLAKAAEKLTRIDMSDEAKPPQPPPATSAQQPLDASAPAEAADAEAALAAAKQRKMSRRAFEV